VKNYNNKINQKENSIGTKQLRIDELENKLSQIQIRRWIKLYCHTKSDLEKEAFVDEAHESSTGTGAYLAVVRFKNRLPNLKTMHGIKFSMSYKGIAKMCKNYYSYH
jgi:hypothetical protein